MLHPHNCHLSRSLAQPKWLFWGGSAATRRNMVIHNSMMRQSHVAGASTEIYRNRFRVYVKLMKPRLSCSTEHRWVGKFNKPKTPSCRISDSTCTCRLVCLCLCNKLCQKHDYDLQLALVSPCSRFLYSSMRFLAQSQGCNLSF